jgi:hypothetical protein
MSSSFHYLNRGTWATHVQFASLACRLESSHLLCAKPPKSPMLMAFKWPVDGPYNKNSTVKTSGSRGVYDKFHAHFEY